ncbi:MAG: 30S ribosomal protein S16 [Candidatus Magasanikbacteria bacterium]
MLIIRLSRVGKTKCPAYRFIVSEKARDTKGTYLELLGNYNPNDKENKITIKADRVKYWISKGAQMSNTVSNLFLKNGIISGAKKKSVYLSEDRKKKIAEKKKASEPKAPVSTEAPKVEAPAA